VIPNLSGAELKNAPGCSTRERAGPAFVTPGGYTMSVAMTNCGRVVTVERIELYSVDPWRQNGNPGKCRWRSHELGTSMADRNADRIRSAIGLELWSRPPVMSDSSLLNIWRCVVPVHNKIFCLPQMIESALSGFRGIVRRAAMFKSHDAAQVSVRDAGFGVQ